METTKTYYSRKDIAREAKLSVFAVRNRQDRLGIEPLVVKGNHFFTPEEMERIIRYKKSATIISHAKERFTIIEYFLTHDNNTTRDIAEICPLSHKLIDKIIFEYYKNDRCIIVNSKL